MFEKFQISPQYLQNTVLSKWSSTLVRSDIGNNTNPLTCCKAFCSEQGRSIIRSLSFLVEFLSASFIRLIVSSSCHFITRSNPHADHLCNAKPNSTLIWICNSYVTSIQARQVDGGKRSSNKEKWKSRKARIVYQVFANQDTDEKEVRETVWKRKFLKH